MHARTCMKYIHACMRLYKFCISACCCYFDLEFRIEKMKTKENVSALVTVVFHGFAAWLWIFVGKYCFVWMQSWHLFSALMRSHFSMIVEYFTARASVVAFWPLYNCNEDMVCKEFNHKITVAQTCQNKDKTWWYLFGTMVSEEDFALSIQSRRSFEERCNESWDTRLACRAVHSWEMHQQGKTKLMPISSQW